MKAASHLTKILEPMIRGGKGCCISARTVLRKVNSYPDKKLRTYIIQLLFLDRHIEDIWTG